MKLTRVVHFERTDPHTLTVGGRERKLLTVQHADGDRQATVGVSKPQPPFIYRVPVADLPDDVRALLGA